MRLSSFLLVALVCLVLALECRGRIVSRCELRNRLNRTIALSERAKHLQDVVVDMLVCQIEKMSQRDTGAVRIYGRRVTMTTIPPANNNNNDNDDSNAAITTPPANQNISQANDTNDGQNQNQNQNQNQENEAENQFDETTDELYDEEGEYFFTERDSGSVDQQLEDWLKLMELLNEEENRFDEEVLAIADDKLGDDDGDVVDDGGLGSGAETFQKDWSLGYHGIFQLSDSYFCQSSARWSQNVCKSSCSAFSDDDITDDLDCFINSLYWLYVLRTAGHRCYKISDFFSGCK
ncbi:uncharacterized protein LOC144020164 [Festucalex cinctus]